MSLGNGSSLNTLVHPMLYTSLPRVYPSTVTIQQATETQGDDYSIIETWADVVGLENLRGILAAATAEEVRQATLTNVTITHVLDLQDYYPAIEETYSVLVSRVEGETETRFNITGIKHDSQASTTRLELELVSN